MIISIADRARLAVSIGKDGTGTWAMKGDFGAADGVCEFAGQKPKKTMGGQVGPPHP
jgi:hypothetical protein